MLKCLNQSILDKKKKKDNGYIENLVTENLSQTTYDLSNILEIMTHC